MGLLTRKEFATNNSVHESRPISNNKMELTSNNYHLTRRTTSDLAATLRNPERVMPQARTEVLPKSLSYEIALPERARMNASEMDLSFREHVMDPHTI